MNGTPAPAGVPSRPAFTALDSFPVVEEDTEVTVDGVRPGRDVHGLIQVDSLGERALDAQTIQTRPLGRACLLGGGVSEPSEASTGVSLVAGDALTGPGRLGRDLMIEIHGGGGRNGSPRTGISDTPFSALDHLW